MKRKERRRKREGNREKRERRKRERIREGEIDRRGRAREQRSISELHFMLSHPLNYQKPKPGWVWPSSNLSTQGIFEPPNIPTVHKIIFLLHKKPSAIYKNSSAPKNFSSSKKCLKKTVNFCRALRSFSRPKFLSFQKTFLASFKKLLAPQNFWHQKIFCVPEVIQFIKNSSAP